jgi:hypothetical protein
MLNNKEKLVELGFKQIGYWVKKDDSIDYVIEEQYRDDFLTIGNVLYAFIVGDDVKYIGKTSVGIQSRFYGYKKPGNSQSTNIKCNKNIRELPDKSVKIWLYVTATPLQILGFDINLAAGLEDSLIHKIHPEWNSLGKSSSDNSDIEDTVVDENNTVDNKILNSIGKPQFQIRLGKAYYYGGFINPGVGVDNALDDNHGEPITVVVELIDGQCEIINSFINRTANQNHTVRVVGNNHQIATWFQSNFTFGDTVEAHVENRNMIVLHLP